MLWPANRAHSKQRRYRDPHRQGQCRYRHKRHHQHLFGRGDLRRCESRALAEQLGDRVNIYPVKGYAITVALPDAKSQAAAPNVSLLDDEAKLVTSRLGEDRFRIAGTAEFNGYNRDIRADRIRPLVAWVNQCFPDVGTRQVVPWAGLRPMMPDMMPKVGRGRQANVFYNTGHGHLGWTLSAATASLLAEEMCQAESAQFAKGEAILPEPLAST